MKNLKLAQSNQGRRIVWLGVTIGLATLFFAILLWGLREAVPAYADPGTLYVDGATGQDIIGCGTTGAPCETISYTLNSRAGEGDTILIAEGTYTENLTITGITVTLRGGHTISGTQWLADTGETIVHGGDAGRVFFIHGSNSVLENLTITGGDAPPAEPWGGGVWVTGGDVTIRYSTITGNGDADWSMGIEVNDDYGPAHLTLVSSTVSYNFGGGLHLYEGGTGASAEVRDATFVGNTASYGGGIALENGSSAVISNSRITSNASTGWAGGGIGVTGSSTVTIENNQIVSNTADNGAGIAITAYSTATIENNQIVSNTANSQGGGLFVWRATVTVRSNDFFSNTADSGGGISTIDYATATIESNQIVSNTADLLGGGLYAWRATVTARSNDFLSNASDDQGGGMAINDNSTATIEDNQIVSNTANSDGGGLYVWRAMVTARSNDFFNNTANAGGGMTINDNSTATIEDNQIASNTANVGGGGLYTWESTVTVRSNDFLSNTSQTDDGPAIWTGSSTLAADYNLFAHNVSNASWVGGAVRLCCQTTMTLTNNVIARNQASGFQVTESSIALVNNTIVSNTLDGITLWDSGTVPLLRNNIIADNGAYAVGGNGTVTLSEYNDLWNNPSGSYDVVTVTLEANNIALDPQFVDAAHGDYHLQGGSPCIDAGTSTGAPMEDYEEDPRPLDGDLDSTAAVDMGADEFDPPKVYLPLVLRDV